MKLSKPLLVICLSVSTISTGNAINFGGSKSGKKFDYEACGKIVEGQMTYEEAEELLAGEPTVTGKSGDLFYRKYYYEKGNVISLSKLGIGGSQGKAMVYECVVLHNKKGIVTSVNMTQAEGGGSSAGF